MNIQSGARKTGMRRRNGFIDNDDEAMMYTHCGFAMHNPYNESTHELVYMVFPVCAGYCAASSAKAMVSAENQRNSLLIGRFSCPPEISSRPSRAAKISRSSWAELAPGFSFCGSGGGVGGAW